MRSRNARCSLLRAWTAHSSLAMTLAFAASMSLSGCRRDPPRVEAEDHPRSALHDQSVDLTPAGMENARIQVERVTANAFSAHVRVPAEVRADPDRLAHVGARTAGRVVSVDVHLGDVVHRGDPIAQIDTVELHQVSMEYLTAVARARQARDALARQRQLTSERIGAEADLRRAEADSDAASAALREGEEHLHFLGLTDRDIARVRAMSSHGEARSTVRAPIEGRIESVGVSIGQVVSGTEDLATIAQTDAVWIVMRVYEHDAPNVRLGTTVQITTPGAPERTFDGTVSFVSSIVDPVTRTFEARAQLANPDGLLRPGMSASASVAVHAGDASLWLPVDAVQPHGTERMVFVQTGERRFVPRIVLTGEERNGFVPVTSGIAVGEMVVTRGAFALRGELERSAIEGE